MKKVTAFKCDWCSKLMRYEECMRKHELACMKNPEPVNCFACSNAYYAKVEFNLHVTTIEEVRMCCDHCGCLNKEGYISHNHAIECGFFQPTKERLRSCLSTKHDSTSIPYSVDVSDVAELRKKQVEK